jgi:hypothetical protein
MSVVNGQVANQTTFNAAFMSRIAASTSTLAIVQLLNTDIASGATVANVQALLNKFIEGLGTTGIGDTNINNYGTPNYVVNGQTRKQSITALDTQLFSTQSDLDAAEVTIADHETRLDAAEVTIAAHVIKFNQIENLNSTFNGNKLFTGSVSVQGNLEVLGALTYVAVNDLDVTDKNITVNNNGTDLSSEGAGILVERLGAFGSLIYKAASASKWALGSLGLEIDVADISSIQTFTNKTINAALNTISNISLTSMVTGILPIANGGTNAATTVAAFNNLSPLTTKGDIPAHSGTNNVRLPVGTNGQVLTADSSAATGLAWSTPAGAAAPYVVAQFNANGIYPVSTGVDGYHLIKKASKINFAGIARQVAGTSGTTQIDIL